MIAVHVHNQILTLIGLVSVTIIHYRFLLSLSRSLLCVLPISTILPFLLLLNNVTDSVSIV